MKNIGLIVKVFSVFYLAFFLVSIIVIEFILRLLTPFSISDADSKLEVISRVAFFDVPPVIIMAALFYNSKINKK